MRLQPYAGAHSCTGAAPREGTAPSFLLQRSKLFWHPLLPFLLPHLAQSRHAPAAPTRLTQNPSSVTPVAFTMLVLHCPLFPRNCFCLPVPLWFGPHSSQCGLLPMEKNLSLLQPSKSPHTVVIRSSIATTACKQCVSLTICPHPHTVHLLRYPSSAPDREIAF